MYFGIAIFSSDEAGNNFSINIPDKSVIFHRISKLNFLGDNSKKTNTAFLFEITFRNNIEMATWEHCEIKRAVLEGIETVGLAQKKDLVDFELRAVSKAYVIYDLKHRKNTDAVLKYLSKNDIYSCGRFAEFEYLNMDQVIEHAFELAQSINQKT